MPDEALEERLAAVERALNGADRPTGQQRDRADIADRLAALEADVAELEAAVQAVRGYVGGVKHVNDEVEQRADAAMAKAEAVERALEADRTDDTTVAGGDDATTVGGDDSTAVDEDDTTTSGSDELHPRQCPRCGGARGHDDPPAAGGLGQRAADGGEQPWDDDHGPSSTPGHRSDEFGHRTFDGPDDAGGEGLLARLREVL